MHVCIRCQLGTTCGGLRWCRSRQALFTFGRLVVELDESVIELNECVGFANDEMVDVN